MGAQHGREDARLAGEPTGVARDRAPRALGPTDLEHHDRLAAVGRAIERRDEAVGLAHGFEEQRDHPRRGIVDQVVEEVHRFQHGFVPR